MAEFGPATCSKFVGISDFAIHKNITTPCGHCQRFPDNRSATRSAEHHFGIGHQGRFRLVELPKIKFLSASVFRPISNREHCNTVGWNTTNVPYGYMADDEIFAHPFCYAPWLYPDVGA